MNSLHLPYAIHVTALSIGDKAVILETEDKLTIQWPKSQLPSDITVGAKLQIAIVSDEITKQEREKMAKQLLNEILNSGEKK